MIRIWIPNTNMARPDKTTSTQPRIPMPLPPANMRGDGPLLCSAPRQNSLDDGFAVEFTIFYENPAGQPSRPQGSGHVEARHVGLQSPWIVLRDQALRVHLHPQ